MEKILFNLIHYVLEYNEILIKLRKLIKAREKNLSEPVSSKSNINHKSSGESVSYFIFIRQIKTEYRKKIQSKNSFLYIYCFSIKFFSLLIIGFNKYSI